MAIKKEEIKKTPEQILNEALSAAKSDWNTQVSLVTKFKRWQEYRKEVVRIQAEHEQIKAAKISELQRKEQASFDFTAPRDLFSVRQWMDYYKYKSKMSKAILIHMELTNGDHTHFIAYPQKEQFEHENKLYIIDSSAKYYDHAAKMYCMDYHEDLTLPIIRRIPLERIREGLRSTGITDIENACNPSSLKQFIESEIIQKVMKGQEFEDMMKTIKTFLIITMVVVVVHLLLFIFKSGILQSIRIPGIM